MEFGILGPVQVRRAGRPVPVRSLRQRTLLATLLVHRGEVVSTGVLVDALWGADPPRTALNTLQAHVSALRRVLADHPGGSVLRTRPLGYQLAVGSAALDAARFSDLVASALVARDAGRLAAAADGLRRALALWRGPALADVPAPALAAAAAALEERRLHAVEERADLDLRLGRHAELAADLRRLVTEHPLRERLWEQLVLALHRGGRRADALLAYRDADLLLRREIGVEPGPALRELHRRVLAGDPALDPPRVLAAAVPAAPVHAAPVRAAPVRAAPVRAAPVRAAAVAAVGRADAVALRRRGDRLLALGRWAEAGDCLERSAAGLRRAGDRQEEAHSRLLLAALWWLRGEWDRAADTLVRCLPVLRDSPDDRAAAAALRTLGVVRLRLGEPAAAAEAFRESLARLGPVDEGEVALTRIQLALAAPTAAAPGGVPAAVRDDLAVLRRDRRRDLEAHVLPEVAAAARQAGDLRGAADLLGRGMCAARAAGDPLAEAVALHGLGEVHARNRRWEQADRCLGAALERVERLGAAYWRSRVLVSRAALRGSDPGPD